VLIKWYMRAQQDRSLHRGNRGIMHRVKNSNITYQQG